MRRVRSANILELGKIEELLDQGSIEVLFLRKRLCKDKVARIILFLDLIISKNCFKFSSELMEEKFA